MNAGHRSSPDVRWTIQNVPYEVSYGTGYLQSTSHSKGEKVVRGTRGAVVYSSGPQPESQDEEYAGQQEQEEPLEVYVQSPSDFGHESNDNYQQMALQSYGDNEGYSSGEQADTEALYEQSTASASVRSPQLPERDSRAPSANPEMDDNPTSLAKLLPSGSPSHSSQGGPGEGPSVSLDTSHLVFHSSEHGLHGLLLDRAAFIRHSEVLDLHRHHQIISSHISSSEQSQFLGGGGEAVALSLLSPMLSSHRDPLASGPSSSSTGSTNFHPKHMLVQKYAAETPSSSQQHHLMVVGDGGRVTDPYVTSSVVGMETMYVDASPPPPTSGHQTLDIYLDRGGMVTSSTSHRELLEQASRFEQSSLQTHSYVSSTVDLPVDDMSDRASPHHQVIDSSEARYHIDATDGILHSTTAGFVQNLVALSPGDSSSTNSMNGLCEKPDQSLSHQLSGEKDPSLEELQCCVTSVSHPDSTASEEISSHLRPRRDGRRFWCDDCGHFFEKECTRHRIQLIFDKPVLSRAWASLPATYLYVNKIGTRPDYETLYGVFAKKTIPKRTQFGPIEGVLVKREDQPKDKFLLVVEQEDGVLVYLDTSDESLSNWMRFVRPADNHREQNLILVQQGQYLYFNTTRSVNPRTELRVWYSTTYAQKWTLPLLEPDEEERKAMEEQENAWPCFECKQRFPSSEDLQKHLNQHDDELEEGVRRLPNVPKKPPRIKHTPPRPKADQLKEINSEPVFEPIPPIVETLKEPLNKKPRGRPPKKFKQVVVKQNEFHCSVCGKLFPRQYSLQRHLILHSGEKKFKCPICDMKFSHVYNRNRHLRRHRQRGEAGTELRLAKRAPILKRRLACMQCNLYFDNPLVLSLHLQGHSLPEQIRDLCNPDNILQEQEKKEQSICPECQQIFSTRQELFEHAGTHGKLKPEGRISRNQQLNASHHARNPVRPFKCNLCYKSFTTDERLIRHYLVHGSEDSKPLQCSYCYKRFLNNSALSCHIKVHSDEKKFFECPICKNEFEQINTLKEHVHTHYVSGFYTCPHCQKVFEEYNQIRKHIRAFHSERRYPCDMCEKVFPRPDKLKLHMLRHSDHREFLCANCGKQFKRKDKLKEHMKRMHAPEREARLHAAKAAKPPSTKKFIPKVSPQDYHRFIYKCHQCLLGFKRRGMLVNHLAKRHPEVRPDSVPELNLPILKTTRDYYCQYCEKIYKSSSKRKAHILRNHPGAELPMSNRRKVSEGGVPDIPGLPNPTFSQTVGSITTHPHHCTWCHKQYASKAKLLQHQRKKHLDLISREKAIAIVANLVAEGSSNSSADAPKKTKPLHSENLPVIVSVSSTPDSLPSADLLTQAMSELTQALTEFRPVELVPRITIHTGQDSDDEDDDEDRALGSPTPSADGTAVVETTTIDPSQFSQLLAHYQQQQQLQQQHQQLQQQQHREEEEDDEQPISPQALVTATGSSFGSRPWPLTITNYQGR